MILPSSQFLNSCHYKSCSVHSSHSGLFPHPSHAKSVLVWDFCTYYFPCLEALPWVSAWLTPSWLTQVSAHCIPKGGLPWPSWLMLAFICLGLVSLIWIQAPQQQGLGLPPHRHWEELQHIVGIGTKTFVEERKEKYKTSEIRLLFAWVKLSADLVKIWLVYTCKINV